MADDERRPTVTRRDVARRAGVSTAVVSYVVNGGPRPVSAATAARVRTAILELGYRPNSTARALAVGRTRTIGLVVPDSTNAFFAEYAAQVQRCATARDHAVLITTTGFDPAVELRSVLDLCDRGIDGLLLARAGLARMAELAVHGVTTPVVLLDATQPTPGHTAVGSDAAGGAAAVVGHLLDAHAYASVAMIIGASADPETDGRESGWARAHTDRGRTPGGVERTPFSRLGGYRAGWRLLERRPWPAAVFVSSDTQAVGFLRAAHELGVRVPEDVAVVGFDGTEESGFCWPPLTTARQPTEAMADAAVAAVLAPGRSAEHRLFAMELVVRASCGCPAPTP